MARRIIIFGATGFTGRLLAQRLAAQGATPVLAGRSEASLRELAEPLGLEWQVADALRQNSVFALLEPGDVLVSTVGPFVKWGEPAVRAAIAARSVYIDSTGEPSFIRRVFDEFGPPAERAGAALLPAMGYDYVPGALAAGAGAGGGRRGARCASTSATTPSGPASAPGRAARRSGSCSTDGYAFRDGALRPARIAERVRSFHVRGKDREAVSVGGSEHFTLPAVHPGLEEVNVYLGWFGALARPLQAGSLAGSVALRVPGVRGVLKAAATSSSEVGRRAGRARLGHLVGGGRGLRRRRRAARRGPPVRRRAVRADRRHPRLGGAPRRRRGRRAHGRARDRSRRSGCARWRPAAARRASSASAPCVSRPGGERRPREQPGRLEPAVRRRPQRRPRGPVEQPPADAVERCARA